MPIRPFLADKAFDQDAISEMSLALEKVCDALSLNMIDDAATRVVAQKIIELAQRGVRDADTLQFLTLQRIPKSMKRAGSRPTSRGCRICRAGSSIRHFVPQHLPPSTNITGKPPSALEPQQ